MTPRPAPPAEPILGVAPQPGKETLGCGGLIAWSVRDGRALHIHSVTADAASPPGSFARSLARRAAPREVRAAEALRRLGAGAVPRSFLGLPDAAMPAPGTPAYAKALGVILDALDSALVVLPWRRDPHCDTRPQVLDYAIWFDEIGVPGDPPRPGEAEAVALDVSPALKRAALRPHPSQRGELVLDDSGGFVLGPETILCLTGPEEVCW